MSPPAPASEIEATLFMCVSRSHQGVGRVFDPSARKVVGGASALGPIQGLFVEAQVVDARFLLAMGRAGPFTQVLEALQGAFALFPGSAFAVGGVARGPGPLDRRSHALRSLVDRELIEQHRVGVEVARLDLASELAQARLDVAASTLAHRFRRLRPRLDFDEAGARDFFFEPTHAEHALQAETKTAHAETPALSAIAPSNATLSSSDIASR
ncbi:MAG: hypothetical protein K8S98_05970 [Planctomycetes bacterium]|nr:hypothetical protein [Planctomycetota bacterium]